MPNHRWGTSHLHLAGAYFTLCQFLRTHWNYAELQNTRGSHDAFFTATTQHKIQHFTLWLSCVAPCNDAPVYLEQNSNRPGNTGLEHKIEMYVFQSYFRKSKHCTGQMVVCIQYLRNVLHLKKSRTHQSSPTLNVFKLFVKPCMLLGLTFCRKSM